MPESQTSPVTICSEMYLSTADSCKPLLKYGYKYASKQKSQ